MTPSNPVDVVVLGAGHYVTGLTSASGAVSTDKDFGVILPSLIALRDAGWVRRIYVVGQSPEKASLISARLSSIRFPGHFDTSFEYFVNDESWSGFQSAVAGGENLAAIIALPDHLHLAAIEHCKKKAIPFLVVKPALTNLSDYYQATDGLPDKLLARVDYHKVFDPANRFLVDKIRAGAIGKIAHVQSVMTQKAIMGQIYQRWLHLPEGPNVNHYLGSHYIHLTSMMSDASPVSVRALTGAQEMTTSRSCELGFIACQVDWEGPDQKFSSTHLSGWVDPDASPSMTRQEIRVYGLSGSIESNQAYRGTWMVSGKDGYEIPNPHFFSLAPEISGQVNLAQNYGYESVRSFIEAVVEKKNDFGGPVSLWQSEKVAAILDAADKSLADSSRVVEVVQSRKGYVTK